MIEFLIKQKRKISFLLAFAIFINCIPVYALDVNSAVSSSRRSSSSAVDSSARTKDDENTENTEQPNSRRSNSEEKADDNSSSEDEKDTDDSENKDTENGDNADESDNGTVSIEKETVQENDTSDDTAVNANTTLLLSDFSGHNDIGISVTNNDVITISSGSGLILLSNVDPAEYAAKTISVASGAKALDLTGSVSFKETEYTFQGLGSDSSPFTGSLEMTGNGSGVYIKAARSFFECISDSATLTVNLTAYKNPDDEAPLLARNVKKLENGGGDIKNWTVNIKTEQENSDSTQSRASAGVIGMLGEGAKVGITVNVIDKGRDSKGTEILPISSGNGYRGAICNEMEANSSLTFNYTENSLYDVTSKDKDAGGIVGHMASGATLTINGTRTFNQTVTATSGNAGGIVGSAEDINSIVVNDGNTVTVNSSLVGGNAGGYIGSYTANANTNFTPKLSNIILNSTLQGIGSFAVGGVFGILDIKENRTVTVTGTESKQNSEETISATTAVTSKLGGNVDHYGGIVGRAIGVNIKDGKMASSFIVKNIKIITSVKGKTVTYNYGGIAGETAKDNGKSLYFNVNNVIVDMDSGAESTSAKNIGGVVGCSNENSMIDICDIKVIGKFKKGTGNDKIAGLVAYMGGGVVRLSGKTDLSEVTIDTEITNKGQLVGPHDSLVYAEKKWKLIRQTEPQRISDIADWGEVVRLDGFDENDRPLPFEYDDTSHTVTLKEIKVDSIATKGDFAALAIAMSCYNFGGALANQNSFTNASSLYSSTININNNIDMSGTGIYSLTRDTDDNKKPAFKGIIDGNGYTVTLNSGELYGNRGNDNTTATGDGSGQIYDHSRVAFLASTQGATVKNLTIDGNFKAEVILNGNTNGAITVAAISAKTAGLTIENVTVKSNIIVNRHSANAIVGGFVGTATNATINATDCTLAGKEDGKLSIKIIDDGQGSRSNGMWHARIGGFVAEATNSKITIKGLSVEKVDMTATAYRTAGGFLGYSWLKTNVVFEESSSTSKNYGINVSNSSLNYANDKSENKGASFGGMVNKATGYWQVNENGIKYEGGVTVSGATGNLLKAGVPEGTAFIVACGVPDDTQDALYLEILPNGYVINDNAIELSSPLSSSSNIDEVCGTSIRDNAGRNNAVISIATDENHTGIDLSESACNTYKNKILDKSAVNSKTRYYYNLDAIKGGIDSADKLMCTALVNYRAENIRGNFSGNTLSPIAGKINLTGYSYYPVSMNVPIEGATITFDNKGICTAEDKASNKCPTDTNINQHYLMHCGLFYNVAGSVNVTNLTLNGTVGRTSDNNVNNSGALVYGTISGSQNATSTDNLNGITLDGITVYNRHTHSALDNKVGTATEFIYAPLLINKIGNYVTLDVTGVTQTKNYVSNGNTVIAGSSLIGDVGSTSGTNIRLSFSNIQLDARQSVNTPQYTDKTRYGGTTKTIFTRATLLNSFSYSDVTSCSGKYNFTSTDEYTYGYEIGNGDTDVGGKNPNNQMWYYGQNGSDLGLIKDGDTTIYDNKDSKNYTNYIRYVYTKEAATNGRHELDINQMSVSILAGCGTYSDPYIITDGNQLRAIAKYLNGTAQNGLGLTFDSHVLDISYDDNTTAHTIDNGTDKHIMYIYENKKWYEATYDSTQKEYKKNTPEKTGDNSKILAYIRNAYYLIQPTNDDYSITMPSDFTGLGGLIYTGDDITVFSGAVIGKAKTEGTNTIYPTVKITYNNKANRKSRDDTEKQFGGIVRTSAGAVVKDLVVEYTDDARILHHYSEPNLSATKAEDLTNQLVRSQSFFGGVVGYCTSGDTIIDNVYVNFKDTTITVWGNHKCTPIGGYVGLVGGAIMNVDGSIGNTGGGVVFRNIDVTNYENNKYNNLSVVSYNNGSTKVKTTDEIASDETGFYYCNPYVGRVLDGYAVSEDKNENENENENYKLNNTNKNYNIVKLKNSDKLQVNSSNEIELSTPRQLWILGAVVNSGSATYIENSKTYERADGIYYRGRARTADYSSVGTLTTTDGKNPNREDDAYWGGVERSDQSNKYAYLVKNYTNNKDYFRKICDGDTEVQISLTNSIDMTSIGAGFRGIGTSFTYLGKQSGSNNYNYKTRVVNLNKFNGNSKNVTLNSRIYSYNDEQWQPHELGLFSAVGLKNDVTVSGLTLKGSIKIYAEKDNASHIFIGGFAGTTVGTGRNTITFEKVRLGGDLKDGEKTAFVVNHVGKIGSSDETYWVSKNPIGTGGFVGGLWNIETNMVFNGCSYNNISVSGPGAVGGLVGRVFYKNSEITVARTTKLSDDNYDFNNSKIITTFSLKRNSANTDIYGIGGLVGYTASAIRISNVRMANTFIDASGSSDLGLDAGGFVGYINNDTDKRVTIKDCDIVNVGINGALRSGGVLGTINGRNSSANRGGTTTINNVTVDGLYTLDSGGSGENYTSATAGLVGLVWERLTVENSTVKNSKIISKRDAGGLAGGLGGSNHEFKIKNVTIDNSIIASVGDKKGAGGIVGTSSGKDDAPSQVPVYGYNILIQGTAVGYWLNSDGNGVYSNPTIENVKDDIKLPKDRENGASNAETLGNQIGLYNNNSYIKYSGITYTKDDFGSKSYAGVWFGAEATTGAIKLIAVQTKDCYLPLRMYGNKANTELESNDIIIYADYNVTNGAEGLATNPEGQLKDVISNSDTDTVNPYGDGTSGESITTDEAVTKYVPILSQILTELKNSKNLRPQYSNMLTIAESFDDEDGTKWNSDNGGSVFSSICKTVQTGSGYSGDFPVIVVSLANSKSVDEQIKTALSLLTNSDQRSVSFTDSDVLICNTYKYDSTSGKFKKADEASISFNRGKFTANSGKYDNGNDQFTLIQVKYTSETDTSDTYSVWLPIILKKTLDYTFTSKIENGTNYWVENYGNKNLLSGHGEKNTALLTFTYEPSNADWVRMLNNGERFNWGLTKTVTLRTVSDNTFPVGTEFVLVDRTNGGKAYYYTLTQEDIGTSPGTQKSFTFDFTKFKSQDEKRWSQTNLTDQMNIIMKEDASGGYVEATKDDENAIKAGDKYYKYDTESDAETKYSIESVEYKNNSGTDGKLKEEYYLTIKTPAGTEGYVNGSVNRGEAKAEKGTMAVNKIQSSNPEDNGATTYIIGSFFKQGLTVSHTAGAAGELSQDNNIIHADLSQTINFENADNQTTFRDFTTNGKALYQGFSVWLNQSVGGTLTTVDFPAGTKAKVTYKIYNAGGITEISGYGKTVEYDNVSSNTVLMYPDSIRDLLADTNYANGIVVKASVDFVLSVDGLSSIPKREGQDSSTDGVQVVGKAMLSYTEGNLLSTQTVTDSVPDNGITYYTQGVSGTSLVYTVNSVNRRGANGIVDGSWWPIDSTAYYDVSEFKDVAIAAKIKAVISLSVKDNDGQYQPIADISKYLSDCKVGSNGASLSGENKTYEVSYEWSGKDYTIGDQVKIPVSFKVLTGSEFETRGLTYANYKVTLTVYLLDESGKELEGSSASDYIIYTNAKVLTDVIGN